MSITEITRRRILGIYSGTVVPESGIERHFARVCQGDAIPVTGEEREWYQFVTQQAALRAREESERISAEVARRVAEATKKSVATVPGHAEQISHLSSVVERQQKLIQSLLKQLDEAKLQLQHYQHQGGVTPAGSASSLCPVCNGDGGIRAGCYKCGGTGWQMPDK
jgi:uncharacterized protein YifE (UPF0438 family)